MSRASEPKMVSSPAPACSPSKFRIEKRGLSDCDVVAANSWAWPAARSNRPFSAWAY
jgi:hypothetical protein